MSGLYDGETLADGLRIRRAGPADVAALVEIADDTSAWLLARGRDPGVPPRPLAEIVTLRVSRGETYLALLDDAPAGTVTLQWSDSGLWPDLPGEAGYVRGLLVKRAYAGRTLGLALLRWAEREAASVGKATLRLECDAANPAICAYYERAGYASRGESPARAGFARYERRV